MKIPINKPLWNFTTNSFGESSPDGVYCDGWLYRNMELFSERNKNNYDTWIIVSGEEGDGKSFFTKQCAFVLQYINNFKYKIDNNIITSWTPSQFRNAVLTSNKFDIIIYDEAISGMSARRAMSSINTTLISMAAQCRKRNLFVFIILPAFHDLDKNIAIHRSRALLNVYADKFKRGSFAYFTKEQKKFLYINGKKYYDMGCQRPEFRGKYTNWSMINEIDYEQQKDDALNEQGEQFNKKNKWLNQRNALLYYLASKGMTHEQLTEEMRRLLNEPIDRSTISDGIRNYIKEFEAVGGNYSLYTQKKFKLPSKGETNE